MSEYKTIKALRKLTNEINFSCVSGAIKPEIDWMDAPHKFNSDAKSIFIKENFFPATSASTGKTRDSSDEERGIYQLAVYSPILSGDYGETLSQAVDAIKNVFWNGASTTHDSQNVDILEVTSQGINSNDSWNIRVIKINYLTYSER